MNVSRWNMPVATGCSYLLKTLNFCQSTAKIPGLLDKLGGGAWQAKKAKLKERIREVAEKLIRLAAERALRKAPILQAPAHAWEEFSARFPYQETEDQMAAIEDVVEDIRVGAPHGPFGLWRCRLW